MRYLAKGKNAGEIINVNLATRSVLTRGQPSVSLLYNPPVASNLHERCCRMIRVLVDA